MVSLAARSALLIPDWPVPGNIRALVTTRLLPGNSRPPYDACNLGLRSAEDAGIVQANRSMLVRALGLSSMPRWLHQVHGTGVARFDPAFPAKDDQTQAEPQGDAALTCAGGVVLAILSADCLPVLLCADDGSEIAAVHAGWRGLAAGVVESCCRCLRTPTRRMRAWLGPAIGPGSYEVGKEVRSAFMSYSNEAKAAFAPTRVGHWSCDLYMLAQQRLRAAGVAAIYGGGFDTASDSRFYSYRRDGAASGRFATLIWRDAIPGVTQKYGSP